MKNGYDYEPGQCLICKQHTDVRWKNLYVIGSEGVNICHKCEMEIVHFVENRMMSHHRERVKEIKNAKSRLHKR